MKCLLLATSMLAAQGQLWGDIDYSSNGRDWPMRYRLQCDGSNQSPIDLKKDVPNLKFKDDKYFKHYERLVDTTVKFIKEYKTNQVSVDTLAGTPRALDLSYFDSMFGKNLWGAPSHFQALQFHLHSGSEHTIEGKRYDLEMHTLHYSKYEKKTRVIKNGREKKDDWFGAALGILFDTKDYDKSVTPRQVEVIDKFFESLDLNARRDHTASLINFGELVSILDTSNRWIYKGSETTPPCTQLVYWNVLNKVYPIKEKHLKAFKEGKDRTGNFRLTNKVDKHDVQLILDEEENDTTVIILAVFVGLFGVASLLLCVGLYVQRKKTDSQMTQVANDTTATFEGGNTLDNSVMQAQPKAMNETPYTTTTTLGPMELETDRKV